MNLIIKTCKEMLLQRGYTNIQTNPPMTEDDDSDKIIATKDGKNICIYTTIFPTIGVDKLKSYIGSLNKMKITHGIVIYSKSITPPAKKLISERTKYKIEVFKDTELKYNITKHRLVPQHILLNPTETKKFKKQHSIKFSSMYTSDPVARFYNYKPGNIIKILRKDGSIGYRVIKYKIKKK